MWTSILLSFYIIILSFRQNFKQKLPTKKYKECYYTVVNLAEKYNLKHEASKAIKIAIRDGVFYGLKYETEDSFYIKQIDPKFAKISSVEDGVYMFSFDLGYFSGKEYLLDIYGSDFRREYDRYKGNKEKGIKADKTRKWYEVKNGIVLKSDESDPFYSLPLFINLLLSVYDIEDYKLLQKAKAENDNYKLLSAKLETQDGIPVMDYEMAAKYFSPFLSELPSGVGAILSPFEVKDFSFQKNNASERNAVTDAENDFWSSAGTANALFGGTNITSSSAMLLSTKPDEAVAFALLQQFERSLNKDIKKKNLEYNFKIQFSNQSIFNSEEFTNRYSKAAQYGVGKLLYGQSLGMSPSDIIGMSYLEDDILELSKKMWTRPLVSSAVQSGNPEDGGRPTAESKGESISDSNQKTRDSDANDNR